MSRHVYRVAIQIDRSWCVGDDDEPDFEDPVEVATDEAMFAFRGEVDDSDERARAVLREIAMAMDAILRRHGVERTGSQT